jgi:hypothetical protein
MPDHKRASIAIWDQFESELADLRVGALMPFGAAIGTLARKHECEAAESLLLASVSFCANYDEMVGINDENTLLGSYRRYKAVAALASDIAALDTQTRTCKALVAHWVATDDRMFKLL